MIASMLAIIMCRHSYHYLLRASQVSSQLSNGNYNINFNGGIFTETNRLARTLNKASYEDAEGQILSARLNRQCVTRSQDSLTMINHMLR